MCNKDNCECKKDINEDLDFFLEGCIDEAADATITIPREEYDELISESTILRVIEKMLDTFKYNDDKLVAIRAVLEIGKPEPEPDPVPDSPIAYGPDKEDAE